MEDDRNSDRMDFASEDVTSTTNTAHEPRQPQNDGEQDERGTSRRQLQQQQQAQNLETWLQLIETAIQPFQQPNQVAPINSNSINDTRKPPHYTIQHGILSAKSNHSTEVVGSSMVKVTTSSPASSSIHTNNTETTSTILISTVTLQVGQPSIMTPKQGDIMVTLVHRISSSSSSHSSSSSANSHGIHSIQSKLQRVLDENMDLEQLHVIEGKIAYRLVVTVTILFVESITCLTFFDACLVSAIAALLDTKLPTRPMVHDDVLYNSTTLLSSTDTTSCGSSFDPTIETKPLHMPVVPISFTAIGVQCPDDTIASGNNDKDQNSKTNTLHWIGDPTMDEQLLSDSTVATIVMNAAAITTKMNDDPEEEEDQEDILCLQLTPITTTTGTNTITNRTFTASCNVPTTTTTTAVVSCHDVDTVVSMARRHVQSMFAILQPK